MYVWLDIDMAMSTSMHTKHATVRAGRMGRRRKEGRKWGREVGGDAPTLLPLHLSIRAMENNPRARRVTKTMTHDAGLVATVVVLVVFGGICFRTFFSSLLYTSCLPSTSFLPSMLHGQSRLRQWKRQCAVRSFSCPKYSDHTVQGQDRTPPRAGGLVSDALYCRTWTPLLPGLLLRNVSLRALNKPPKFHVTHVYRYIASALAWAVVNIAVREHGQCVTWQGGDIYIFWGGFSKL